MSLEFGRLKVSILHDGKPFDNVCRVCGAKLEVDESDLDRLSRGLFKEALSYARYYEILDQFIVKVKERKYASIEELEKDYRRLQRAFGEARPLIGFTGAGTIRCRECNAPISLLLFGNVDTHLTYPPPTLEDYFRLFEGLEANRDYENYFKSETGRSWRELREEAKSDPAKWIRAWNLLVKAGAIGTVAI